MNKEVKKDILRVLKNVQPLLIKEDIAKIKVLSNQTLHNASMFQDPDSISISVIIFSLSKILNRPRLENNPALKVFKEKIAVELFIAKNALEKDKEKEYKETMKRIFQHISRFEKKFGMYITQVLEHAKIKRGERIYEHGFSAGKAAQLLGISSWELMSYVGETKIIPFVKDTSTSTRERINFTRRLFSI
ncbi:MAG: hypothetical protein Q8R18_02560 [bacterium]|nr:hypothetical protein [bacterium]